MKKLFLYVWLAVGLIYQVSAQSGTINVSIQGIENTTGNIEVGLYNSEIGFPDYDDRYQGEILTPSASGVSCMFQHIPEGTYAIAVWHDENKNKKIDKNWLGIPTENYGFSLNTYGKFGPPHFEDVAFKVEADQTSSLIITLK